MIRLQQIVLLERFTCMFTYGLVSDFCRVAKQTWTIYIYIYDGARKHVDEKIVGRLAVTRWLLSSWSCDALQHLSSVHFPADTASLTPNAPRSLGTAYRERERQIGHFRERSDTYGRGINLGGGGEEDLIENRNYEESERDVFQKCIVNSVCYGKALLNLN